MQTTTEQAALLLAAFDSIADDNNQVTLLALREVTGLARAEFDSALQTLRGAGGAVRVLTLEVSDGRHARVGDAERAAGIREGGRPLVYAARI